MFHSYAFDFSVWELWGALIYGGKLVIVPYWISRSPDDMYRLMQQQRVTVLNQTPSNFFQLDAVDAMEDGNKPLSLRLVIFGGEALEPKRLRGWFERHGDIHPQLVNMYGITETTVHVTWRTLSLEDTEGVAGCLVGRPLSDLHAYLLDAWGHLVPAGVAGELYIGGAGLARGYLNRPDLTAERFVPNPFNEIPGERLYRTGDLARYRADGVIEYLGRIDHQVKIRGFRIELGEIETQLLTHPSVKDAVVLARDALNGGKHLVAYIVGTKTTMPEIEILRQYLQGVLPDYMVPSAFVALQTLPLTANGKLDRNALPDPDFGAQAAKHYVAPRNETEAQLAAIWAEVLELARVGIHDNFFELGGHSLLATQVISRVRSSFDIELPLRALFDAVTVARLSTLIDVARLTSNRAKPAPNSSLMEMEEGEL